MKKVLDPCCGSKMFWFDKHNPIVEYCDIREIEDEVIYRSADGKNERHISVLPDKICDVTNLPYEDNSFYHIVFDPPHLTSIGDNAWMCKKYGKLDKTNWDKFLHDAFCECMRVLKPNGTLIFKWNETDIPVSKVLSVIPFKPLYGHQVGKLNKTHWIAFLKDTD